MGIYLETSEDCKRTLRFKQDECILNISTVIVDAPLAVKKKEVKLDHQRRKIFIT